MFDFIERQLWFCYLQRQCCGKDRTMLWVFKKSLAEHQSFGIVLDQYSTVLLQRKYRHYKVVIHIAKTISIENTDLASAPMPSTIYLQLRTLYRILLRTGRKIYNNKPKLHAVFNHWLFMNDNKEVFLGKEKVRVLPSKENSYDFIRRPDDGKSLKRTTLIIVVGDIRASQKKPRKRRINNAKQGSNAFVVEDNTVTKRVELPPVPRPSGIQDMMGRH